MIGNILTILAIWFAISIISGVGFIVLRSRNLIGFEARKQAEDELAQFRDVWERRP